MNSIIVTKENNEILYCAYIDGKLQLIEHDKNDITDDITQQEKINIGDIFVGHVENISQTQHAAFVRFSDGIDGIGYLPFDQIIPESVINRKYDNVLKCNDIILVQIRNGRIKTKQADLTTYLSIAGQYCVITRGKHGIGCSRKIESSKASYMVGTIYKELTDSGDDRPGYGIILRTEAGEESVPASAVIQDISFQSRKLDEIIQKASFLKPFSVVYHKDNEDIMNDHIFSLYHFCKSFNSITDKSRVNICNADETSIKCDDKKIFEHLQATTFASLHPEIVIKLYDDQSDLKTLYAFRHEMDEISSGRVWLNSGAYIIIEKTEAMNVIDVNTGRTTTHGDNAFLKINMEAASECMRQIRLRNLTGMILIDFINMHDKKSDQTLADCLDSLCSKETIRTSFVDITGLGIAEITRSKRG